MHLDTRKLAGSLKAAILIRAVGRNVAGPLLEQLPEDQKSLILRLQAQVGDVPDRLVEKVVAEFLSQAGYLPAPEEKKAEKQDVEKKKEKQEEKKNDDTPRSLKALQSIAPDQLFQLIKDEHPQTIALIVAHLKPSVGSDILSRLPDELKSDVALRIANLDKIISGMVEEVDKIFEQILKDKDHSAIQEAGGVSRLAEILNQIDGASAEQIIDDIEENDPELADEIKQKMFVFEDIILVDDKGLQKVLRAIETQELAMALKAASDEVKEKIFSNMSERAADILKEEMEVSGAVRMKDVTDAQQKITKVIQEMERKGELIISGRGGEEFIG